MGDMAVYQKTTTLDDGYFQDDDDISNIQLIPPCSKRTATCSSCVQRWCTALLVVCLALLVTGLIVLGVMVRQLQTELNALKGVDTQQSIGKSELAQGFGFGSKGSEALSFRQVYRCFSPACDKSTH